MLKKLLIVFILLFLKISFIIPLNVPEHFTHIILTIFLDNSSYLAFTIDALSILVLN